MTWEYPDTNEQDVGNALGINFGSAWEYSGQNQQRSRGISSQEMEQEIGGRQAKPVMVILSPSRPRRKHCHVFMVFRTQVNVCDSLSCWFCFESRLYEDVRGRLRNPVS